jgi:hypothetical protein
MKKQRLKVTGFMDFIHRNLKTEEAAAQNHWVYGLYPSESEE